MTDKEIKNALVIKVGDEIEINSRWNAYNQKIYTVLEVVENRLTCRLDAKNLFGHKTCTYFKDELARKTVEKYSYRNNIETTGETHSGEAGKPKIINNEQ